MSVTEFRSAVLEITESDSQTDSLIELAELIKDYLISPAKLDFVVELQDTLKCIAVEVKRTGYLNDELYTDQENIQHELLKLVARGTSLSPKQIDQIMRAL